MTSVTPKIVQVLEQHSTLSRSQRAVSESESSPTFMLATETVALSSTAKKVTPAATAVNLSLLENGQNNEGVRNAVKIYVDQKDIFPFANQMVDRATRSIELDMFFFGGDRGLELAERMVAKAAQGVKVRVMHDPGMGYHQVIKDQAAPILEYLKSQGVEVLPYPIGDLSKKGAAITIVADHNKALVIDGKEAFVGGMNFSDINAPNHDMMVHVVGPAAAKVRENFNTAWMMAGGRMEDRDFQTATVVAPPEGRALVHVTTSGISGNTTKPLLLKRIAEAEKRIWVEMFSFTDDQTVNALIAAKKRGVDVRVILDPNKFAFGVEMQGLPNVSAANKMIKAKIPVQYYNTKPNQQMHIKMVLFDDKRVMAGSTNWTLGGLQRNNETTLDIEDRATNLDMEKLYTKDWANSQAVPPVKQFKDKVLSQILDALDNNL